MNYYLLIAATALAPLCFADTPAPQLNCDHPSHTAGLASFCRMVEVPAAFLGQLTVTTDVGGVSVTGWDNPGVLVRARIETSAPDAVAAQTLAWQVQADVAADRVSASGPAQAARHNWTLTFEIFLPHEANLSLTTKVGGVSIADVKGDIRFNTSTGGVSLTRLAGDVQGSTKVGGIAIVLGGDHWDGTALKADTSVGGIEIDAPLNYSAHFAVSTALGNIATTFPVAPSSAPAPAGLGHKLTFDMGSGGAAIEASTSVGGIVIKGID